MDGISRRTWKTAGPRDISVHTACYNNNTHFVWRVQGAHQINRQIEEHVALKKKKINTFNI